MSQRNTNNNKVERKEVMPGPIITKQQVLDRIRETIKIYRSMHCATVKVNTILGGASYLIRQAQQHSIYIADPYDGAGVSFEDVLQRYVEGLIVVLRENGIEV